MSRYLAFAATFLCAAPAYAQTTYFAAIPDLPVATGLVETPNELASFAASDDAGLVIVAARGPADANGVRSFYMNSLSQLGWAYEPSQREEDLMFMRGRERLIIHIEPQGAETYLGIRLIVRPASMNAD